MTLAAALILLLGAAAPLSASGCTCASTAEVGTWCTVHEIGHLGGVEIKSAWLFETLDAHGHDLDLSTFTCPACRRAIDTGGFCDEHRTGFVGKRVYFSWLTYALARGTRLDPAEIRCPACRRNATTSGWCERDRIGFIGGITVPGRASYDRTVTAIEIVKLADRTAVRCKHCAAAIVTDTTCPVCRIRYKDGKRVAG